MATKIKAISYIDRITNKKYVPNVKFEKRVRYRFTTEQTINSTTGIIVRKTKKVPCDNNHLKAMKCSDFALSNLQAIGAIDKLKQCNLNHDTHTTISNLENQATNIINSQN